MKSFYPALVAFIKKYHTTGLVWNPKGGDASSASAAAPAAAAPKAAAPAKPKPKLGGGGPGGGGLFAELNKKGADGTVTSGLKKVDRSQMTHKNPELRASSVVKAEPKKTAKAPAKKFGGGPKGDPVFELSGNKWKVEFQQGAHTLEIAEPETKHVIYMYGCTESMLTVKGKVNSIMMDNCKKCVIVFQDCVSVCEIVNCKSARVQILGKVPSVAIDKTSGCQVFLSKDCLDCEFVTAKSDEMNIVIPPESDDADITEYAVPEQFKTTYDVAKKCLITEAVAHV
jgi:adenylyl cyclase-associated protein